MSDEELAAVGKQVNEKIRENVPVVIKTMPKDEAIAPGRHGAFRRKNTPTGAGGDHGPILFHRTLWRHAM